MTAGVGFSAAEDIFARFARGEFGREGAWWAVVEVVVAGSVGGGVVSLVMTGCFLNDVYVCRFIETNG